MTARNAPALYAADAYPTFLLDPDGPAPGCLGHDPELWFPGQGGSTAEAKAICRSCPLVERCGRWALTRPNHALFGVWGGLSDIDRAVIKRRAAKARTRANATRRAR